MGESRVKKSLLNARVNLIFYVLALILSFFSRKIFLDCLGAEFVGLTGTLQNILGYLNLAEFGVGAAIAFNLYKPLQENNREKINELISLFGYYYRIIGLVVLGGGVIVSGFIPLIFKDSGFSFGVIYFAFYAFLISSLIGYFVNYRTTLLAADQRNYVVAGYLQSANLCKILTQIAVVYYTSNYYAWIAIDLVFGVVGSIILNRKIDKTYPWLRSSIKTGKAQVKKYPNILQSTKQIFVHKFKDFLLQQSDQIFVFALVSLKMVAYYGNYVLIISKVTMLFSTVLDSVVASVGNLVAENDKPRMMKVFWELMAVRYFLAGFLSFNLYYLITPFIGLWLGDEYILGQGVLILFVVNMFIGISRGTVDNFNFAYGHYGDVWAAWTEGLINLSVTIICGHYWGIFGILLGKTASLVPIVIFWKPLYLFRSGFRESCRTYWSGTVRYYIIFAGCALAMGMVLNIIPISADASWGSWLAYGSVSALGFGVLYLIALTKWARGGRDIIRRLPLQKIGIKVCKN